MSKTQIEYWIILNVLSVTFGSSKGGVLLPDISQNVDTQQERRPSGWRYARIKLQWLNEMVFEKGFQIELQVKDVMYSLCSISVSILEESKFNNKFWPFRDFELETERYFEYLEIEEWIYGAKLSI